MWCRAYLERHGYITIFGTYSDEAEEYIRACKKEMVNPTYDDESELMIEAERIFDVAIYNGY